MRGPTLKLLSALVAAALLAILFSCSLHSHGATERHSDCPLCQWMTHTGAGQPVSPPSVAALPAPSGTVAAFALAAVSAPLPAPDSARAPPAV
jgi:hypothetical protein